MEVTDFKSCVPQAFRCFPSLGFYGSRLYTEVLSFIQMLFLKTAYKLKHRIYELNVKETSELAKIKDPSSHHTDATSPPWS